MKAKTKNQLYRLSFDARLTLYIMGIVLMYAGVVGVVISAVGLCFGWSPVSIIECAIISILGYFLETLTNPFVCAMV